jgi:hypothetical protein
MLELSLQKLLDFMAKIEHSLQGIKTKFIICVCESPHVHIFKMDFTDDLTQFRS